MPILLRDPNNHAAPANSLRIPRHRLVSQATVSQAAGSVQQYHNRETYVVNC
jgi:hypothetical protein